MERLLYSLLFRCSGGGGGGLCNKSCYLKFADKDLVDKMEPLDAVID